MSPALLYLLLATTPTTPPATITPTPTTMEAPMAQGNQGQASIQFPIRHPNQPGPNHYAAPGPAHRGTATGYPTNNGTNRITTAPMPNVVEHTNRPR